MGQPLGTAGNADRAQLRASGSRTLKLAAGSAAFVALGLALFAIGVGEGLPHGLPLLALGLLSVVFFGAAGVVGVARHLRGAPLIEIGDDGVTLPNVGQLGWADIDRAEIREAAGQRFVGIWPRDPAVLDRQPLGPRLLSRINVAFGFPPLTVPTVQMDETPEAILERIARSAPRETGPS